MYLGPEGRRQVKGKEAERLAKERGERGRDRHSVWAGDRVSGP